jgi:hypothetical protein
MELEKKGGSAVTVVITVTGTETGGDNDGGEWQ